MTTPTPPTSGRQDGQYRKKPVVIEAFRMGIDPRPDWFTDKVSKNEIITHVVAGDEGGGPFAFARTWCEIKTLEGVMTGEYGDFIIQGVKGEVYPCKSEIFALTYERVRPPQPVPTATPGGMTGEQVEALKLADLVFSHSGMEGRQAKFRRAFPEVFPPTPEA